MHVWLGELVCYIPSQSFSRQIPGEEGTAGASLKQLMMKPVVASFLFGTAPSALVGNEHGSLRKVMLKHFMAVILEVIKCRSAHCSVMKNKFLWVTSS